jgi:hypothetical protein
MSSLEALIAHATKDGRVCPQPMLWNRLWELLPDRRKIGTGWEPPIPLILGAWWHTSDSEKRARFQEHLRWAFERGAIEKMAEFISNMKPEDWHTEK